VPSLVPASENGTAQRRVIFARNLFRACEKDKGRRSGLLTKPGMFRSACLFGTLLLDNFYLCSNTESGVLVLNPEGVRVQVLIMYRLLFVSIESAGFLK